MTLISYFNFRRFILIAILGFLPISVIAQSPQPDSIAARSAADSLAQSLNYKEIRGIERAATPAFYTPRKVLHAIFWLPRFTIMYVANEPPTTIRYVPTASASATPIATTNRR